MKSGSVFSGIGGGDLAFECAGVSTEFQIEDAKFPRRVLEARWPEVQRYGDVKTVDPRELPAVDVLHGGFPCQDLSVAGGRAGLAGERSSLFHEFRRLAAALRPAWVVIENVPGLLSSQSGRDMGIVLGELADLGYGWAYRVLDAQYFGLAQRRKRVFIVGCLGDAASAAAVLFEPGGGAWDSPPGRETGETVANPLTTRSGERREPSSDTFVVRMREGKDGGGKGPLIQHDLSGALATSNDQTLFAIADARAVASKSMHGLGDTETGPMYTLDTMSEHAVAVFPDLRRHNALHRGDLRDKPSLNTDNNDLLLDEMDVRKLTPLEQERLQGFPEGWTCLCSAQGVTAPCTCKDGPRTAALGNAIAVPVMEWIARRIVDRHEIKG